MKSVPGCVPSVTATLQATGALSPSNVLHLVVGLPRHNQRALDQAMQQIYDPSSIRFHHYLTPSQFRQLFGPTGQDYQTLINFANASGLTVERTLESRMLLGVNGTVAAIEQAFHIHLLTYQHPTEPRQFYAPDTDPNVDAALPILDIAGLTDYPEARPASDNCFCPADAGGSGPDGTLWGKDFRNAYVPGVTNLGTGQILGLVEFETYVSNDITEYELSNGLPSIPLINVPLYNTTNITTNFPTYTGSDEPPLDIEMAISMAPGLQNVTIFLIDEGGSTGWQVNEPQEVLELLVDQMASSNQISQFSCSWKVGPTSGYSETDPTLDAYLQQMAMQGQSFFQASGDRGPSGTNAGFYSVIWIGLFSPYLTSVGGTELLMTNGGSNYVSETVWNNIGTCDPLWGGVSGGGISSSYLLPLWQQGLSNSANLGSATMRMIPDVAAVADHVWCIFSGTNSHCDGGTSAAAPLWAGFMALVNQQAVSEGNPTAGFINPALYLLGTGTSEGD